MKLSDITCKTAKAKEKPYKIFDGGGLYLLVSPKGHKAWKLKYRYYGKDKKLSLGTYPQISLKEARIKCLEAKTILENEQDPSEVKKAEKRKKQLSNENTFEKLAREWHEVKGASWKPKHAQTVMTRLEKDIFPVIGNMPVTDIEAPMLLEALRKIENRGAIDIAKRMRQTVGQILRYGIASGKAKHDIAHELRDSLKSIKTKHHPYLKEHELPEFLQKLDAYNCNVLTRLAIRLTIYNMNRTGEVLGAQWQEFDIAKQRWQIPAHRMKMSQEHIVPLSHQTIELLSQIKTLSPHSSYLFPSRSNLAKPMSSNTMIKVVERIGYKGRATMHGFRATASTILNEKGFNADIIERQLAHGERNKVRAAYNHAQYLDERANMMQWWADYVDKLYLK